MAKKSDSNFGGRLLIMAYAVGIVLIGAHPFEKQHGGLFNYLKKESSELLKGDWLPDNLLNSELKFELGDIKMPSGERLRGGSGLSLAGDEAKIEASDTKNSKELDRLSKSDRTQLDSLIDAVAQE